MGMRGSGWDRTSLVFSKEVGFDAHLVKPVEFDALTKLLASEPAVPHP
jgi:hypothetical protein